MSRLSIARHAALVAAIGVCGLSSTAAAQRTTPRPARGPDPVPARPSTPYPGATVYVDQWAYTHQPGVRQGRPHRNRGNFGNVVQTPVYYPVEAYGSAGGVYDTNGRPLWAGYEAQAAAPSMAPAGYQGDGGFPAGTPDLSGSPYAVIDGGAMVVDFGNGDRRPFPSCGAVEQASTPDGQPRTIFYRPPAYALALRPGQRGQVLGRPAAGAKACYRLDQYGRTVLAAY
jgi:hypothetical protein